MKDSNRGGKGGSGKSGGNDFKSGSNEGNSGGGESSGGAGRKLAEEWKRNPDNTLSLRDRISLEVLDYSNYDLVKERI